MQTPLVLHDAKACLKELVLIEASQLVEALELKISYENYKVILRGNTMPHKSKRKRYPKSPGHPKK